MGTFDRRSSRKMRRRRAQQKKKVRLTSRAEQTAQGCKTAEEKAEPKGEEEAAE